MKNFRVFRQNPGNHNILKGGAGDDQLFGGHGNDTAVFLGELLTKLWQILSKFANGLMILKNVIATQACINIEILKFRDRTVKL